jgi:GPH family glycoside/pentoside/hexuronide:cation symporter
LQEEIGELMGKDRKHYGTHIKKSKPADGKSLPPSRLFGYGIAGISDSGSYNLISSFLLFFLTSVAKIPAIHAGVITSIGTFVNGAWSPFIGYISDNSKSRFGRRRPYIIGGGVLACLSIGFLFRSISSDMLSMKYLYYGLLTILFWLGFTCFANSHMALGAELTDEYHERTRLRSYTSIFYLVGAIVGTTAPTFVIALLDRFGMTEQDSWSQVSLFTAILLMVPIIVSWRALRGSEKLRSAHTPTPFRIAHLLKAYFQVLRLKPMRYIIASSIFFLIANTLILMGRMYYMTYNMKLSTTMIGVMFLYVGLTGFITIPLSDGISKRTEKRTAFLIITMGSALAAVLFGFIGIDTITGLFVFLLFTRFPMSCYYQIFPSMCYDICELDEFVNGKRREGIMVSILTVTESLATSITLLILSGILNASGFNEALTDQKQQVLDWMFYSYTFLPAVFYVLSMVAMLMNPMTKTRFAFLKDALEKKRRGDDSSAEGFRSLL